MSLSKCEKASLRASIANYARTIKDKGNAPLSEREISYNQSMCKQHFDQLCSLKELLPLIFESSTAGLEARIKFVTVILQAGISSLISGYVFFDIFDIGPRQFDTCFEMNDGDLVMEGLVAKSSTSKGFREAALQVFSESTWMSFESKLNNTPINTQILAESNQLSLI